MKDHLPRHVLEKLVADDPQAPVHPALRVHVAGCDHCTTRKRALEAVRARYLVEYPALDFASAVFAGAAAPEPSTRRAPNTLRLLAIAVLALVVPAIGVFWFASSSQRMQLPAQPRIELHVSVEHAGTTRTLIDAAHLEAGDQLTFAYALDRPRYLLLLAIDARGTITRHFPTSNAQPSALAAAARTQLPVRIVVDARRGETRLFALFFPETPDEAEARGALARALSAARGRGTGIAGIDRVDLPGAQQLSLWFQKP